MNIQVVAAKAAELARELDKALKTNPCKCGAEDPKLCSAQVMIDLLMKRATPEQQVHAAYLIDFLVQQISSREEEVAKGMLFLAERGFLVENAAPAKN